ncbi:MAG: 6-pyruvoyl-tetrahydropterin synthase-related protein [Candidatus Aenigmarchaeota archaeon]|nr:6-pyruvoyl-tetrahydropterin synthase-related protein [Candidatus Aenigmarchaeota archaeon]
MSDEHPVVIWTGSSKSLAEKIADAIVLLAIFGFLLSYFKPELMLSLTTTAGGDTASHFYPAEYLRDALLPAGRLVGWAPGWYGGLPMFQFYFLPAFTPFLFMEANSMWGGNIPSTLAGEFSYSLGFALTLLFFGTLHRSMEQPEPRSVRWLLLNAVLFALVTLSHAYTMLFAGVASTFFLLRPLLKRDRKAFVDGFVYFVKMYGLAFLLSAFWLVPLAAKLGYTTSYNYRWVVNSVKEAFPDVLLPFYMLSAVGVYALGRRRDSRVAFILFTLLAAGVMFVIAGDIGVVDIRFVPFVQFYPLIIAAAGACELVFAFSARLSSVKAGGRVLGETAPRIALLLIVATATLLWTHANVTFIDYWIQWNYSGFEGKTLWPAYSALNNYLHGDASDPRVVYEHSPLYDAAGSLRAFESLPLFSGRSTLEGLYMQSTPTSPFVFYIQSQISEVASCPLPGYACTFFNSAAAARRLEMFNVKQVITRSDKVKADLASSSMYRFVRSFDPFDLYELLPGNGHYVTVPKYEPVVFDASSYAGGWKAAAYEWFKRDDLLDVPLVFSDVPAGSQLTLRSSSLDSLPKTHINGGCNVSEVVTNDSVLFHTDCVGVPHIISISYYPNWQAEGADGPYLVSPSFMVVIPRQPDVTLHYGTTFSDTAGVALTIAGVALFAYAAYSSFSRSQKETKLLKR